MIIMRTFIRINNITIIIILINNVPKRTGFGNRKFFVEMKQLLGMHMIHVSAYNKINSGTNALSYICGITSITHVCLII